MHAPSVKEAWEALERSWEEFEGIKYQSGDVGQYKSQEEIVRWVGLFDMRANANFCQVCRRMGQLDLMEIERKLMEHAENLPLRSPKCHPHEPRRPPLPPVGRADFSLYRGPTKPFCGRIRFD